jgi:hypothetical protein
MSGPCRACWAGLVLGLGLGLALRDGLGLWLALGDELGLRLGLTSGLRPGAAASRLHPDPIRRITKPRPSQRSPGLHPVASDGHTNRHPESVVVHKAQF